MNARSNKRRVSRLFCGRFHWHVLWRPPVQTVAVSRSLAIAYSKGIVSWPEIAEETGASYGELLVALGLNNLKLPQARPKKRPEQIAFFNKILDAAVANKKERDRW